MAVRWESESASPVCVSTQGSALSASIGPPGRRIGLEPLEMTGNAQLGALQRREKERRALRDGLGDQPFLGQLGGDRRPR